MEREKERNCGPLLFSGGACWLRGSVLYHSHSIMFRFHSCFFFCCSSNIYWILATPDFIALFFLLFSSLPSSCRPNNRYFLPLLFGHSERSQSECLSYSFIGVFWTREREREKTLARIQSKLLPAQWMYYSQQVNSLQKIRRSICLKHLKCFICSPHTHTIFIGKEPQRMSSVRDWYFVLLWMRWYVKEIDIKGCCPFDGWNSS